MDDFVITYDLEDGDPSPYETFIEEAEKQGLLYVWRSKDLVFRMPNTTVWGRFEKIEDARAAFDRAARQAGRRLGYTINVEKRMTVQAERVTMKSNVSKAPEKEWMGKTRFETARLHQLNDPDFAY